MGAIAKITNVGNICYLREKVLPMKSWINPFCALWVSLAVCFSAQARDNSRYVNLFMGTENVLPPPQKQSPSMAAAFPVSLSRMPNSPQPDRSSGCLNHCTVILFSTFSLPRSIRSRINSPKSVFCQANQARVNLEASSL